MIQVICREETYIYNAYHMTKAFYPSVEVVSQIEEEASNYVTVISNGTVLAAVSIESLSEDVGNCLSREQKHLLDRNRTYFRLLRKIAAEGQRAGQLRADRTVNEIVKAYALWERALLYDWCLCGGEYSLVAYTDAMTPTFLESWRG